MGWLDRLRRREPSEPRRSRNELVGLVEALEPLAHPLTGEACVALEYDATPPGILPPASAAFTAPGFTISLHQAVDFVLSTDTRRVLVRVADRGQDVGRAHRHLSDEHGFGLEARVGAIFPGDRVRVQGTPRAPAPSDPYREVHWDVVLEDAEIVRRED